MKKFIQIIKTKLDLLEEKEIAKKGELGKDKLKFDFNPLKLKTYDISTIFKGENFSEGGTEYRKDGSIIFSKENEAYKRILDMSVFLGNEEAAAILEHQVLVIPNYANDTSTVSWHAYGYGFEKSNVVDPLLSSTFIILATVHTHPSGGAPSTWVYDGYGDLDFASYSTPYKPVYVFQIGKNQVSLISARPKVRQNKFFLEYNITLESAAHINLINLAKGSNSLRKYTKQITSTIKQALQK